MSDNNQLAANIAVDVRAAAESTARQWSDIIDADDAEQEIWLRILESSEGYLEQVTGLEKRPRLALLKKIGHQIGMGYRNSYEVFSGNYFYGTKDVRDLLKTGILRDVVSETIPLWELPISIIEQIERTDRETLSERIDLFDGLRALHNRNERYALIILGEYRLGCPVHKHNKDLTRAIDSLTRFMNSSRRRRIADYEEGPGTRRVVSNAQAVWMTGGNEIRLTKYGSRSNGKRRT